METQICRLKNGAQCLLIKDKNSPSINIVAEFKAGAREETASNNGVAHLLEHMIFKGSKAQPDPKKLVFKIENLGANINAWTSQELTAYIIQGPKYNANKMISFLAEMLLNPIFPEKELLKEKRVIGEEIRMYEDNPQDKVADEFMKAMFPNHPLGRNIAGSIQTLNSLTSKDCRDFIARHYSSENLLIIVAGDFDRAEIVEKLNQSFGLWPASKVERAPDYDKDQIITTKVDLVKDLEQTHIIVGSYSYSYQELTTSQRWALNLGRTILAGGFGSLLIQRFREELAMTYYIHLANQEFRDIGYYYVALGVNPENRERAIEELDKTLNLFASGKIALKDLERAKNYLIGNLITYLETSSDLASFYAKQLFFYHEITTQEEIIKIIKDIKRDDIIKIWKPLLIQNKIVSVLGSKK
jgi:predicted Zn-dependent peptidase